MEVFCRVGCVWSASVNAVTPEAPAPAPATSAVVIEPCALESSTLSLLVLVPVIAAAAVAIVVTALVEEKDVMNCLVSMPPSLLCESLSSLLPESSLPSSSLLSLSRLIDGTELVRIYYY